MTDSQTKNHNYL